MSAPTAPRAIRSLRQLVVTEICRTWHPSRSLAQLPVELARLLWTELKAQHAQRSEPLVCSAMYPLIRDVLKIHELDLSDSGKWITDTSLMALGYVTTLRSLRLTACRFVTDSGLQSLAALRLETLDISWTQVSDEGIASGVARCPSLTSLNLTGLDRLTDRGVASLLSLTSLRRLALACTGITDAALDYLTYYTRYPDAGPAHIGVSSLKRLELSSCRLTETGVGKLVAVVEDGKPYGKVFKQLEYLALSSTPNVPPSAVMQVKVKYGFDTPLPNAQRTLAKSNAVALDAQTWVLRLQPSTDRPLPAPARSWEQERIVAYVAQYTKEMAAAQDVIRRLTAADAGGPTMRVNHCGIAEPKRQRLT